jgi:cytolysin (calcineurin-like family phosphatase)
MPLAKGILSFLFLLCAVFLLAQTVKGTNVKYVAYQQNGRPAGHFEQVGPKAWAEYKPNASREHATFREEQRDEWSVYLRKTDGLFVQLDLFTKEVKIHNRAYYQISNSSVTVPGRRNPASTFHLIFASDSQWPWTDKTDSGQAESDDEKERRATELNRNHVASMNKLIAQKGNVQGMIMNGDLTAFGHGNQLDKFKEIYAYLNTRMFLGLGNHDYANNVDDTYENAAANRMVEYMIDHIKTNGATNFDFRQETQAGLPIETTTRGSLAYSWDVGNVHFVQLHNYPVYETDWSNYVSIGAAKRKTVKIRSSLSWLAADLANARNAGKAIILNFHDPGGHWSDGYSSTEATQLSNTFKDLLTTYGVSAVFVGHYHSSLGKRSVNSPPDYGNVPVFFCGSASQNKYLLVEFSGNVMKVEKVSSLNGQAAVTGTTEYPLTAYRPNPALPVPAVGGTVENEWYVDIDACHSDLDNTQTANRITVEFWANSTMVGAKYRDGVDVNCLASDARFSLESNANVTHVIVKTNGDDGFYIDELRLYKNDDLMNHHGRDNGSGWCLSTDPGDAQGGWKGKCAGNTCRSSVRFDYAKSLPQPTFTWKADFDVCHSDLDNEGTNNTITVEFWSGNDRVSSKSKRGVSSNCLSGDESFSISSSKNITHILVKTNGDDGFYIDELRLYKDDLLKQHHGRDNGGGWCVSTDPGDAQGSWKGKCAGNTCRSTVRFNF